MRLQRRRWWTRLMTVAAVLTVLAATTSIGFRYAVEAVPGYRAELEAQVEQAVGHRTRIGTIALVWQRLRPTLELQRVALLDAASERPLLEAARLDLGVAFWPLLRGRVELSRVEAEGIALAADVDRAGHWSLRGFEPQAGEAADTDALLTSLEQFTTVRVLDGELTLRDARLDSRAPLRFHLRSATLRHDGRRWTLAAALDPPPSIARRLDLRAAIAGTLAQREAWQGDWQLGVQQLAGWPWLARRLEPGVALAIEDGRLALDGRIEQGRPTAARLGLEVGALSARQAGQVRAKLAALSLRADATLQDDGAWTATVERFALSGTRGPWEAGAVVAAHEADGTYRLDAALLRLDDLAPWLALAPGLPPAAARLRDLRGDIEALQLRHTPVAADAAPDARPLTALSARLHGVGVESSGGQPGFAGLEGQLEGGLDEGRLVLDGQPLRVQLPTLFDQDVPIESLRGTLTWRRVDADWQLAADALDLQLLGAAAEGEGSLRLAAAAETPPLLKLRLRLSSTDAAVLKPLMPKDWGPGTRSWLERALTHARVTRGELAIDAPLTPRAADGRPTIPWRLDLEVADGALAFSSDWPAITGLAAQLHFHDGGLDIVGSRGELGGVQVQRLRASIPDFHVPALVVDGSVDGDAADYYRVLRGSPIKARLGSLLRVTEASGPASADLHLELPLDVAEPNATVRGEVRLDDARLIVHGLDEPLRGLRGRLAFSAAGVTAEALSARLYDTAISARIRPEPESPEGVLVGEFALAPATDGGLAEAFVPSWLRPRLSGSATIGLRLPFSGTDSGRVVLRSELQGLRSELPPPLAKQPDERLPLTIAIGGDEHVPLRLAIEAGELLRVGLRFAEVGSTMKTRGVEVRLGPGAVPLAEADGVVIVGAPDVLDLASWGALLAVVRDGGAGDLAFTRAELMPQRLEYRSYALAATRLVATPAPDDGLHVELSGAASGTVDWRPQDAGRITARLQQASFEALPPLPSAPAEPVRESPFDPARAPLLDLDCSALSLGGVPLGHLWLSTARVPDGQRIERLALEGGRLVVDAHGSWLRRGGEGGEMGSSAELEFDIGSSAIADVLRVFGYAPNLRAEDARFSGRVRWPRVPEGLELSQAEGEVRLDVRRGSLKAVDPGAGRVLGLINLYALPRRLLLDFRDVVSEGLAFDTLGGTFRLAGGNADTRDLELAGPQAKIRLEGRIGLAARDYDQKVTVTPDISTGVTLGATLIGGPIGGGVALVAQQLFGKPFNRLARFSYRVTGSWDNPEVIKGVEGEPPPKPEPKGVRNG